jgi:hypothetical protein
MMDYDRIRSEAGARKQTLLARQTDIPKEKQKLDEEMERIKRELIGIDQILDGLAFMESDIAPDFEPTGFTENIRKILSETPVPLVPTQIRDALEAKGITGSTSKNLLINVHKVLERISDELEQTKRADGKIGYKRSGHWDPFPRLSALAELSGLSNPGALYGGIETASEENNPLSRIARKNHPLREALVGKKSGMPPPPKFYGK